MKRVWMTAALAALFFANASNVKIDNSVHINNYIDLQIAENRYRYERFVYALTYVESRHDPYAVGLANDIGIFQITPIRLKDYNQSTGSNYTLDDLFCPDVSRTIFDYYSAGLDFERAAREWNGGPRGMQKPHTVQYWNKILDVMNNNV